MILQDVIATGMIVAGTFFLSVAAIGFIRLPDVFCRLHVTGVLDTLGAPLILLGAAVHLGPQLAAGKILLGLVFLATSSPMVAHLLARAALEAGHEPGVLDSPTRLPARLAGAEEAE